MKTMTQPELIANIQAKMGDGAPPRHLIKNVLEALSEVCHEQVAAGVAVTIPNVTRIKTIKRAPTPERKTVNPVTREPMTIAAKPETTRIKVSVLKGLKNAVKNA